MFRPIPSPLETSPIQEGRSPQWPALEKKIIAERGVCIACGSRLHLAVHHLRPFHLYPELELVESNLVVLCIHGLSGMNCHLVSGHLGLWQQYNPNCIETAAFMLKQLQGRLSS